MDIEKFLLENIWILYLIIAWTLPWKGVALWKASHNRQKAWFVVILVMNTLAILEIIYFKVVYLYSSESRFCER